MTRQYKFIENKDDPTASTFNHFGINNGLQQTQYQYQHLQLFSKLLFFTISNIITKNPSYLTDINELRKDVSVDLEINNSILTELKKQVAEEMNLMEYQVNLWDYFRLFLYPETSYQCDDRTQKNIMMKFLHIIIKQLILDYNYSDYINYQSIFKIKTLNATFYDFNQSLLQQSSDSKEFSYFQFLMQQSYKKFKRWYSAKGLQISNDSQQIQQIEQQLFNVNYTQ